MYVNIYFWKLMLTGGKTHHVSQLLCQDNTFTNFNKSIANIILNNTKYYKIYGNIFKEVEAKLEEKPNISTKLLSRQIRHWFQEINLKEISANIIIINNNDNFH